MRPYILYLSVLAFLTGCNCEDPELMIVPEELIGLFEVEEVIYPANVGCDEGIVIKFNKELLGSTIIPGASLDAKLNGDFYTAIANVPMYQSAPDEWFIVTRSNACEGIEFSNRTIGCEVGNCRLDIELFSFPIEQFGVQSTVGASRYLDGDYDQEEGGTFSVSLEIQ